MEATPGPRSKATDGNERELYDAEDGDYQAAWQFFEPQPLKVTGCKNGRSPNHFIDVGALARLTKILERPIDERLGDAE
jgi:hypothetical protein